MDIKTLLEGKFKPETDADWEFLRVATQNLFRPKAPIEDDKLFAGRLPQISDVLDAVYEQGGHAVIFGERGVGKTSLAKIIQKRVATVFSSLKISDPTTCGEHDDFYTIWGNALREYNVGGKDPVSYFREQSNPYAVYDALNQLQGDAYHLFIFDEFDRISDAKSLTLMADLIKHFSNNPNNTTIVIVGVGETLLDLFGKHESIARCCSQIRMPRMSTNELNEIIEDRIPKIGFAISTDIRTKIIKLSQGLPGYVHLLGQLSLRRAIDRRSMTIEDSDFRSALSQVLEKADYTARDAYYKAISSANADNKYKEVLLACALAESNELGAFYAGAIRDPYSRIRGREMEIPNYSTNLANLCSEERGPALVKSGKPKRYQYRFKNPLVQPLTIMIGVSEGMINLDEV